MIRVRLAAEQDQPRLIEFIHDHWSASHVFVDEPSLFAWQHLQADGRLNMMLAEDTSADNGSVVGVLGFIPVGRYDPALGDTDIMLAIWKVRDGAPPGLGLRLLKQLEAQLQPRLIGAIGISEMVAPIYKVLRYDVGTLDHTAIFHPERDGQLRVAASVPAHAFRPADPHERGAIALTPLDERVEPEVRATIDRIAGAQVPRKSWAYIVERYLRHPWYDYRVRLVEHDAAPVAVVVWREVEAAGTSVLRIVDVIGDVAWLRHGRGALQRAVIEADAEYIDLMHWGIDPSVLDAAGFVGPRTTPDIVVPNYFSPFERRNIRIDLACKSPADSDRPVRLFRADSDQDRPNRVEDLAGSDR